jgi:Na+/proline symporter
MSEQKMLSIWFFVGLILVILGGIITATGVYFAFNPQHQTALSELNPSLWWGVVMLAGGLLFFIPAVKANRKGK